MHHSPSFNPRLPFILFNMISKGPASIPLTIADVALKHSSIVGKLYGKISRVFGLVM